VTTLVHGEAETARAARAAVALYEGKIDSLDEKTLLEVCAEAPTTTLGTGALDQTAMPLVDLLVQSGLARSRRAARTLVAQGGVAVNGRRVRDVDAGLGRDGLLFGRYIVLQRGRDYHLVKFE
jgi:tyrosyl-tRNA synthetase